MRGGDRPARIWCTIPRKTLFLRFLCTKFERLFGVRPARTWCTIPRKTLFLRFPCTKSGCLFGERPARIWCTNPRKTLFLRFLCTKSGCLFSVPPARTWCTIPRKTLFLRFPCTKSGCLFGERPARIWCTIPRKTLLFRQRAPRLWDQRRRRRAGRGASLPAKPCSFVDGHHVFGTKGTAGEPDVVLHSPQNLALSSTGTTSLGPKVPPASRTWCFTPRKPLLFRRRAPRLWDQRRSAGADLVHDSPQNPVPSFPLHQFQEPFRRTAGFIP